MEKVIILSDNHGFRDPIEYIKATYPHAYYLHLGDSQMHPYELDGFCVVQGNNDDYRAFENEKIVEIGGQRIYMTHGHRQLLWNDPKPIAQKAKANECSIALFGHTHVPFLHTIEGVQVCNPGSIWHNRDGSEPSYFIMTIDGDQITFEKKLYKFPKKG